MRHQDTTRAYKEKGSDLAVRWSKLWLSKSTPENVCLNTVRQGVSDWIGGFCPADSLMVWFPALSSAGD